MSDTAVADAPVIDPVADPAAEPVAVADPAPVVADPATPADPPAEPAKPADPAPVDYTTLELPANAVLSADAIEKTIATARASGFSPDQAQAALVLANALASEAQAATLAAYQPGGAEWEKQTTGWKTETLADVTLGTTPEERSAAIQRGVQVIDRFEKANPAMGAEMKTFLDDTGFGNHRTVAHFFAWLGKAASEGTLVNGPPHQGAKEKTLAQKLYPTLPPA